MFLTNHFVTVKLKLYYRLPSGV